MRVHTPLPRAGWGRPVSAVTDPRLPTSPLLQPQPRVRKEGSRLRGWAGRAARLSPALPLGSLGSGPSPPLPTGSLRFSTKPSTSGTSCQRPPEVAGSTGPQAPPRQGPSAQGSARPSGQLDTRPQVAEDNAGGAGVLFRGFVRLAPTPRSLAGKGSFQQRPLWRPPAAPHRTRMGSEAFMCVQGAPLIGEAEGARPHSPCSPGDATREVRDTGMRQGLLIKLQGRGSQGRVKERS